MSIRRFPGLVNPNIAVPKIQVLVRTGNITENSGAWASTGATWSHTIPSGDNRLLLVVVRTVQGQPTPSGVTYNGDALAEYCSFSANIGDNFRFAVWYLVAPDVGTYDVVISFASATTWTAACVSFANVSQTTPLAGEDSDSGTSTTPSSSSVASEGDILLGMLAYHGSSTTATTVSPGTELWSFYSEWDKMSVGSYEAPTTSGTNDIAWTLNATEDWLAGTVAIKSISN